MRDNIISNPTLKIKNLNGFYGKKQILFDINLNCTCGNIYAIAGPNGAGKTTLLKFLTGQLHIQKGYISVNGIDINLFSKRELAKHISFVSQSNNTNIGLSIEEIVSFGRFCHGSKDKNNKQALEEALCLTEINDKRQCLLSSVSGGEAQLTMIARAICQDTEIMILDEPLNNLDPLHSGKILKILRKLASDGKCIIAVMHDLNAILKASDFCIFIRDGSIISSGATEKTVTEENIFKTYRANCNIIRAGDRTPSTFCYTL